MPAFLTPRVIEILGVLLALAAFGGYMYYKGGVSPRAERDAVKAQFEAFQGKVKVLGEQAQKAADARKLADQLAKEKADHENAATAAANASVVAKLRHDLAARTRGSFVPPAPSGASRPDLACYDRPALESAIGAFIGDVRGFADKGTAATIDLDTAKTWAQSP